MNFNINLGDWIVKVLQKLDTLPNVRKFIWAILAILLIQAIGNLGHLAPLIVALKG